jgi:hypothetical protein
VSGRGLNLQSVEADIKWDTSSTGFADNINTFGDNVDTINKNTETLMDVCKEVGLQEN